MSLAEIKRCADGAKDREKPAGGEVHTVAVPVTDETHGTYRRATRSIERTLVSSSVTEDIVMAAVLASANLSELVMGFLNQSLSVVGGEAIGPLLDDELTATREGEWKLTILGDLERERNSAGVATALQQFITANPETYARVQSLPPAEKDQLVMMLLLDRKRAKDALPRFLESLALKHPEKVAAINAAVQRYKSAPSIGTKPRI